MRTPVPSTEIPKADVSILLETDAGQLSYRGEIMRRPTRSKLDYWLLLTLPQRTSGRADSKPLLLADYLSPSLAGRLAEAGVDYVDAAGNLLIHKPPRLYLFKSGARPPRLTEQRPGRLFSPSGLQMLFVLLVEPTAADLPYRQLAAQSGVALGSVSIIMGELKRKGHLMRRRNGYRLSRKRELFGLWITHYGDQLRPRLLIGTFSSADVDANVNLERLRNIFRTRELDYAITGGLAAEQLTHHYRSGRLAVFVEEWPRDILRDLRWLPSPQGPITILRQFCPAVVWSTTRGTSKPLAHPILIYAELVYDGAERALETAKMIYDQHLTKLLTDSAD
jgi:hypothetical protein